MNVWGDRSERGKKKREENQSSASLWAQSLGLVLLPTLPILFLTKASESFPEKERIWCQKLFYKDGSKKKEPRCCLSPRHVTTSRVLASTFTFISSARSPLQVINFQFLCQIDLTSFPKYLKSFPAPTARCRRWFWSINKELREVNQSFLTKEADDATRLSEKPRRSDQTMLTSPSEKASLSELFNISTSRAISALHHTFEYYHSCTSDHRSRIETTPTPSDASRLTAWF